jgi:CelD/BcsL family acetyltransferase involved in cellulose biosynthesis
MIAVRRIEELEFKGLSGKWNTFIQSSTNDNLFLTHEWLSSWWQSFNSGNRTFYFLLAYDQDENIVGAFPFQLVRQKILRFLSLRLLLPIGRNRYDKFETEYNTFMVPPTLPSLEKHVYQAFAKYIKTHAKDWDMVILPNLLSTHPSATTLDRELKKIFMTVRRKQENNYVIQLAATYKSFLKGLSRNKRRSLKRSLKKVSRHHDPTFSIVSRVDEVNPYLDNYYTLVSQRHNWTPTAKKRAFMHMLCVQLARAGWLRCYQLLLDTVPAATLFGFSYKNRYYAYKAAFNPDFFSVSPGSALYAYAIQKEIEYGTDEFDYLIGEYDYKRYWCSKVRQIDYIRLFGKSLKSRLMGFLFRGSEKGDRTRRVLYRILKQCGLAIR